MCCEQNCCSDYDDHLLLYEFKNSFVYSLTNMMNFNLNLRMKPNKYAIGFSNFVTSNLT